MADEKVEEGKEYNSLNNQRKKRFTTLAIALAGITVSVLTLWYSFRTTSISQIITIISNANWLFIFLGILIVLINNLIKAIRWKLLIDVPGIRLNLSPIFSSLMIGQMLNIVSPVRVGDLTRAYQIGGMGPGRIFVLGTVMVEKVLDLVAFALFFVLLILAIPLPAWFNRTGISFAVVAILFTIIMVVLTNYQDWFLQKISFILRWLPDRFEIKMKNWMVSGLSSLKPLRKSKVLIEISIWTTLIWGSSILTNYLVAKSLNINLHWSAWVLVLLALMAGITIPSIPGKIGLFEFICLLSLGVYGVHREDALAFGILLHLVAFLPIILLGVIFMFTRFNKPL
jgi:uncharacterized protein (TIRG00374 family)